MRRTTICRFSRLALISIVLGAIAAPSVAQQQAASRPQTVVVQPGHTLWDLAEQYLGDPFLWPAIYRLNTDVVEDPHWIFPGEVLVLVPGAEAPEGPAVARLAPSDTAMAEEPVVEEPVAEPPAADEPVQVVSTQDMPPVDGPTVFSQGRQRSLLGSGRQSRFAGVSARYASIGYRAVRRGEFYSSGFLTEGDRLPLGEVVGNVDRPVIEVTEGPTSAVLFDHIAIDPPSASAYQAGDRLWILRAQRPVKGYGEMMVPTGIATVAAVDGGVVLARIDQNFERVKTGLVTLPLEDFPDPGPVRPVAVDDGITGHVLDMRSELPLASTQDVLFIDLGRSDGVSLGDAFAIVREVPADDGGVDEVTVATFSIVHVRGSTATGTITSVVVPDIRPGDMVRLTGKMPM